MNDGFTVITPTGDRPEAFAICRKLMRKQSIKPTEWIIVDDGMVPIDAPIFPFVKYIRRERKQKESKHTLPVQMREAMGHVTTDKVIMMEDDDWYGKFHFENMVTLLNSFDLVGYTNNVYYFLREVQYYIHTNEKWSSFCSTAFNRTVFSFFYNGMNIRNPYIDMDLWRSGIKGKKFLYKPNKIEVLGVKGLPGRIGSTYDANRKALRKGIRPDKDLKYLRSIIGEEIEFYLPFLGK